MATLILRNRAKMTFVDKDGDEHRFKVSEGDNLLDIAQANDLEMEGNVVSSNYKTGII
ncbi:uncharacterized protein KY384_005247 [Bacidia gigantensis]|uniref:uncharacterized protein n=1 Tax=Bacidia gigantensis TaxID=2732470 RepID=UPI001D04EF0D|nr:uncharacterized protein KY384_005247 [Bacidia gigantensis]KAG8529766.1 hypothetical protein KY384_005247 [Bacidia gigantensis]